MRRSFGYALVLVITSILVPAPAHAALIGTLEVVSPLSITYTQSVDFDVLTLSGTGDVTARLAAVDLSIPPPAGVNTTTSGCEAADFAGFAAGSIALLQRGTCTFEVKVANATAAGAVGAIIFNEGGDPTRTGLLLGSLLEQASIPVLGASFDVGSDLFSLLTTSGASVHLAVTEVPDTVPTPEPASILLLGTGLLGVGVRRWRKTRHE